MEEYKEKIKSSSSFITPYPIASKEVSTAFGRCFYLYTEESATIEPKFQGKYDKPLSKVTCIVNLYTIYHLKFFIISGWSVDLISDIDGYTIDWFAYMGPPKLEYPTHSPSLKQEQFLLQANTETFMTFSIEKETFQKKRGLFQSKIYCEDDIQNYEAVKCYKRCFIKTLQVLILILIYKNKEYQKLYL